MSHINTSATHCLSFASALTGVAFAAVLATPVVSADDISREYADRIPQEFKDQITRYSTGGMLAKARALGVREIHGKALSTANAPAAPSQPRPPLRDVAVGADSILSETEPHLAINPKQPRHLVAAMHSELGSTRCVAQTSFDAGATWSAQTIMPQLSPVSTCSDPVLAFSPDGTRVYYAYMDIKQEFTPAPPTLAMELDIVISHSDDGGFTWSLPVIALDGTATRIIFSEVPTDPPVIIPGIDYDKPWIATSIDPAQANWVYVTASRFPQQPTFPSEIAFARSADRGSTWAAPVTLDTAPGFAFSPAGVVVQGSRPAGGMGATVLVAWYHSNGPGTNPALGAVPPPDPLGYLNNSFLIRVRYSSDNGASFGPIVNAAADSYEVPPYLGPYLSFFRYTAAMYPDVKIAKNGSAHIVYTHDPVQNTFPPCPLGALCPQQISTTPEDGDVRYISSARPPYGIWSSPVTLNDDGLPRTQAFPSLGIEEGAAGRVYVTFLDTRLSPVSNVLYDFYGTSRPLNGLGAWLANFRLSEQSSISQYVFIGDYFGLACAGDIVYQLWTDRRHHIDDFIFITEANVFGTRVVASGGR